MAVAICSKFDCSYVAIGMQLLGLGASSRIRRSSRRGTISTSCGPQTKQRHPQGNIRRCGNTRGPNRTPFDNVAPVEVAASRERRRRYGATTKDALTALWDASDRVCGKRLKVMIPTLLPALEQHGRLKLGKADRDRVLASALQQSTACSAM